MRVSRVLLGSSVVVAIALVPAAPASAADPVTWPQVQAAAQAADSKVTQGGGSVTNEITSKISFHEVTDYQPGGAVTRVRYREAGMDESDPDVVSWTVTKNDVMSSYKRMPELPKGGRYPTLRKVPWVRTDYASTGSATPVLDVLALDPLGDISSSPSGDAGIVAASWTHGVEGAPSSTVIATFTQLATGALILRSFSTTDLHPNGPGFTHTVQVGFVNPKLVVPNFRTALPNDYVKTAMHDAQDTTSAYYSVRNAARSARDKATTMTRQELIAFVRSEVGVWEDFSHPPADPSTDIITNVPGGLRLTNPNAYSGQSTIWTVTVTPDKKVVLTKRTKPSKVTPAP